MFVEEIPLDHQYILNMSSIILGQKNTTLPIIDSYPKDSKNFNQVTFIYLNKDSDHGEIKLTGDFDSLFKKHQLHPVFFNSTPTRFSAITLKLPVKRLFRYQFFVNNIFVTDPLNALFKNLDNKVTWSIFFTDNYKTAIIFEQWEIEILKRLVSYILPFKTDEFKQFVNTHSKQFNNKTMSLVSQINYDIGTVNFIDKLIARNERHHIDDYKICIKEIKRVLLSLNPFQEPCDMDEYFYEKIYQIMDSNDFNFWDKTLYQKPSYFLKTLRRHIITAAVSHPKYGGNTDALGWKFLDSLLQDSDDTNAGFDWRRSLEPSLGTNNDYIA